MEMNLNLEFQCGIDGCPEQYRIFDSFRRHVYRLHNEYMDLDISLVEDEALETCSDTQDDELEQSGDQENVEITVPDLPILKTVSLQDMSADLVLQLKFKELVTQNAIDILVAKGSTHWYILFKRIC